MDKYQLNPDYLLRQDGNRVILCSKNNLTNNGEDWFTFIHPLQAMMLSFFRGEKTIDEEIDCCAKFFNLPFAEMRDIVAPFVENDETISIYDRKGHCFLFPRKILIKANDHPRLDYKASNFYYIEKPDYETLRLEYPIYINMELIMQCYTDCCYCYANRKAFGSKKFLETERILDFIQEAYEGGVLQMDINGGEVLLHPGIMTILRKLISCHYDPLISTKIPISKEIIDDLCDVGINRIQISLDSANVDTLNVMLHTDKMYLQKMEVTLRLLEQADMITNINVVLTKFNSSYDEIEKLLDFVAQYRNVKEVRFNPCGYSLYKDNFLNISLTENEIQEIEKYIRKISQCYPQLSINISGHEAYYMYSDSYRQQNYCKRALCTGNVRNAVLLPSGDVTICEELYAHPRFILGNIKQASLKDIWNSKRAIELFHFSQTKKSDSPCHSCSTQKVCREGKGVCWKTVLMAYGMEKWDYPDPRCPKAPAPHNIFYSE